MFKKAILALVAIALFLPTNVGAQNYAVGHSEYGYSYVGFISGNHVWQWPGGAQYTRRFVQPQAYYQNGCLVTQAGYWQYAVYHAPAAAYVPPAIPPVSPLNPNWRVALLEARLKIDKLEFEHAAKIQEQIDFNESVRLLKLDQRSGVVGGPSYPPGAIITAGRYYSTITPISASTRYGLATTSAASTVYGPTLEQMTQALAQITNNSQTGTQQLAGVFAELTRQHLTAAQKRVDEDSRAAMVIRLYEAVKGPPSSVTAGFEFTVGDGMKISRTVDDKVVTPDKVKDLQAKWQSHALQSCAKCHFSPPADVFSAMSAEEKDGVVRPGEKVKGGFNVDAYLTMKQPDKEKVWQRLTNPDDKLRMPPSPAPRLTKEEMSLWFVN